MGVQAGAVRRVLPPELEEERETLLSVERAGRDAVTEMRRLLDLLRSADDAPSGALPTLGYVPQLIADMRRAGLGIELEVDGDLDDVPPGRALAAYRIVQEALTNALKHAPDARVRVRIRRPPNRSRWTCSEEPGSSRRGTTAPAAAWARRHARTRRDVRRPADARSAARTAASSVRSARSRCSWAGHDQTRVLIADDQALVRDGFRMILDAEPDIEVVAEAADGEQALAARRRFDAATSF